MGTCLNLLGEANVFIPTAALLALVLLVWVQLHVHGGGERDVNWFCGVAWAYLAILFALIAVAIFVHGNTSACAKGFLVLAFFMTVTNIVIVFVLKFARFRSRFEHFSSKKPHMKSCKESCEKPPVESLLGECGWSRLCGLIWLATLAGLLLISFSLVGVWCRCCLCIGIGLVFLVFIKVLIIVICTNCKSLKKCRLCTCFRWVCWKICHCCIRLRRGWWKNGEGVDENGGKCGEQEQGRDD